MTIPFFSFCSSSACSTSLSSTVTFRYVFSQNLYLVPCVSASENIAVGKYTLPLKCCLSVSFFLRNKFLSLCLKTSIPYVHLWYARCATSPGVVFIPVFSCQSAILFRSHPLLHKKVLRPVYPQIRKIRKKIPISEISETGTFTLKLFFLQYLC